MTPWEEPELPVIAVFCGIVVRMFYRSESLPSFRAEYLGERGLFDLRGRLLAGEVSSWAARRLLAAWASKHRLEIQANWYRLAAGLLPQTIAPWAGMEHDMSAVPEVIRAEHRGEHRIHVVFNDHTEATIDFTSWLRGPIFEPLEDVEYFKKFFVAGGTVAWPNGADVAPETLYDRARLGEVA